ncbi:hypothetical protein GOP47_0025093 [Adiantum capillus-veneris]|uniref:Glycosyltransferase n=1 Tax=Adiantum capillus-veneris TaxID=13818 RepID=A0A9D4U3B1_ADICA|nr:hypothetical protein GOP47_0025093 [Adiantum capillus-veneris]
MAQMEDDDHQGERKAHVVVLPLPTRGHVNPMMHLAKLLADLGHGQLLVTFVNSETNDRLVIAAERAALQRRGIRLEAIPDGLPDDVDRTTQVLDLCQSVLWAMPAPFDALLARLRPAPTCIMADTWLTFAISAAAKLGIPLANFWTQSAASFASLFMIGNGLYKGPSQGDPLIPGAPFLSEADMNSFARCYDRSDIMFRFVTGGFDQLAHSRWILVNTFDELEHHTLLALAEQHRLRSLLSIGPILPPSLISDRPNTDDASTLWLAEESCLSWLDRFEPKSVLYVSFGSLALVSSKQSEEIALGLELSGHPFLWVTRPDLIYGESPTFNEEFLHRVKDRSFFVAWAPQLKVLNHPSVGGFFTHGGWNSTLEAITVGVPMLGWPYFSDQPMDCTCIQEGWKIGLKLKEDMSGEKLVLRGAIQEKVKELMCSEKFQTMAQGWSTLAKEAAQQGGSSHRNIKNFVDCLRSFE